ncbi:hypothetical protein [Reinekea thalattae]|uniref:Uncharacterized protein n=1 Tax=Reinekea thalattae TaxID=2593301 RepID=A0A5C8Z4I0_9GAMM|nr:hypothetical protein [Reinekea thalattae]TXR51840.1 hypothetical protein FME95_10435 [Reinekea thalattae]
MFHFKRRTLWIIMYITIPLIALLNSLGPDESAQNDAEKTQAASPTESTQSIASTTEPTNSAITEPVMADSWRLSELAFDCLNSVCPVYLPGAAEFYVTVISDQVPVERVDVPTQLQVSATGQAGWFVIRVKSPAGDEAIEQARLFLQQWLPANATMKLVLSGDIDSAIVEHWSSLKSELNASGAPYRAAVQALPTSIASPTLGSEQQLAFLLWSEVLKQRLAKQQIELHWDHRAKPSFLILSAPVDPADLKPVDNSELAPILSAYIDQAQLPQRSAEQIHRYAVSAVLHQLPLSYFAEQGERLNAITLPSINRARDYFIEQIQP